MIPDHVERKTKEKKDKETLIGDAGHRGSSSLREKKIARVSPERETVDDQLAAQTKSKLSTADTMDTNGEGRDSLGKNDADEFAQQLKDGEERDRREAQLAEWAKKQREELEAKRASESPSQNNNNGEPGDARSDSGGVAALREKGDARSSNGYAATTDPQGLTDAKLSEAARRSAEESKTPVDATDSESDLDTKVTDFTSTQKALTKLAQEMVDMKKEQSRLSRAARATREEVSDLWATQPSCALAYPPRGWNVESLRQFLQSLVDNGSLSGSVVALSSENDLPIQLKLTHSKAFDSAYAKVNAASGGELRLILHNHTKSSRQAQQCRELKSILIRECQHLLTTKNVATSRFITGDPLIRREDPEGNGLDNGDDWSIEVVLNQAAAQSMGLGANVDTTVLIQCLYYHGEMKQLFRVNRATMEAIGIEENTFTDLISSMRTRMYETAIRFLEEKLHPLGRRKAFGAKSGGKGKGSQSHNSQAQATSATSSSSTKGQKSSGKYGGKSDPWSQYTDPWSQSPWPNQMDLGMLVQQLMASNTKGKGKGKKKH